MTFGLTWIKVHTIGAPLAMVSQEYSQKAWTEYSALEILRHPSVNYLQARLDSISPESKEATIVLFNSDTLSVFQYDFFVAATGLHRAWPVVPRSFTKSEFLSDVRKQVKAIQDAKDGVVVIGGGEFRRLPSQVCDPSCNILSF